MSKKCGKCEKTVYPTEELKCLDKIWHKACFRCWECSMALNMKNYKGYDKKPYCNAHYPKTSFTAVRETPEMSRIAQNTRMQSQVPYHDDYEKSRGSYKLIPDDLELLRQKQLQLNVSLVKYHEDFEKNIKGSKIQVADDPETLRIKASTNVISEVAYKGLKERTSDMEARRSNIQQNDGDTKRISDYDPSRVGGFKMAPPSQPPPPSEGTPNSGKNVGHSIVYSSQGGAGKEFSDKVVQPGKRVGSIADYDPLNEKFGSLQSGYQPSKSVSQWEEVIDDSTLHNHVPPAHHQPPQRNSNPPQLPAQGPPQSGPPQGAPPGQGAPPRRSPSPERYSHRPPSQEYREPAQQQPQPHYTQEAEQIKRLSSRVEQEYYPAPQHNQPPPQQFQPPPPQAQAPPPQFQAPPPQAQAPPPQAQAPPPQAQAPPPQQQMPAQPPPPADQGIGGLNGPVYQAIYDYEAQDDDEVGFMDGDLIIDCQAIDDGWMFGTIRSSGKRGMLPANYVERVK